MKMMSAFLFSVILTNGVFAGNEGGGGGDVVILPDDTVVLADPWIDSNGPQPNNMPPLRGLNPRILQAVKLYSKISESLLKDLSHNKKSEIYNLLDTLGKRSNNLRFYGVQTADELNAHCASGGKKTYKLPIGALVQQVACTAGNETFLIEPLFLRLNLRSQSLLLIHERLTTLRDQFGGKDYSAIARFTTGLDLYLNLYQQTSLKKYPKLTTTEQDVLTNFYISIEEIEKRNVEVDEDSFQWKAQPMGGGRVHLNSEIAPSALVTLDSSVSKDARIGRNVEIINSMILNDTHIESDSKIINSKIDRLHIGPKTIIKNSSIELRKTLQIEGEQILENGIISEKTMTYLPLGFEAPKGVSFKLKRNETSVGKIDTKFKNSEEEKNFLKNHAIQRFSDEVKYKARYSDHISRFFKFEDVSIIRKTKCSLRYYCYFYTAAITFKAEPILNTNPNEYVINDGRIIRAGYESQILFEIPTEDIEGQLMGELSRFDVRTIKGTWWSNESYNLVFPRGM